MNHKEYFNNPPPPPPLSLQAELSYFDSLGNEYYSVGGRKMVSMTTEYVAYPLRKYNILTETKLF